MEHDIPAEVAEALGRFILAENPYPWAIALRERWERAAKQTGLGAANDQARPFRVVELDCHDPKYLAAFFWETGPRRVSRISKAIRIEYECPEGKPYAVVIGYEGGGGGM